MKYPNLRGILGVLYLSTSQKSHQCYSVQSKTITSSPNKIYNQTTIFTSTSIEFHLPENNPLNPVASNGVLVLL